MSDDPNLDVGHSEQSASGSGVVRRADRNAEWQAPWEAGDPCSNCGSTATYGYAGCAGCRSCHAHDADET